ncbi:hypothetical protein [Alishewanella longhuensis]
MSGTLAENISFFDPQLDMQQVYDAAALAGIHWCSAVCQWAITA